MRARARVGVRVGSVRVQRARDEDVHAFVLDLDDVDELEELVDDVGRLRGERVAVRRERGKERNGGPGMGTDGMEGWSNARCSHACEQQASLSVLV